MATEIRVPTLGESVSEATVGTWFKKVGDVVKADEPIVELETDKVTVEVPAPASGVLTEIVAQNGETVGLGALLGQIAEGASAGAAAPAEGAVSPRAQPSRSGSSPGSFSVSSAISERTRATLSCGSRTSFTSRDNSLRSPTATFSM